MDVIYQGTTWRRRVTIVDQADPPEPVDPDELAACLCVCPEVPIAITQVDAGVYDLTLDADTTACLTPMPTHWELFALIGSDIQLLTRQGVVVHATCTRLEVTP